jgi:hypothetical protein
LTIVRPDVIERVILIHVEAFDWNCPQHITPRYTMEELQKVLAPVREKLATLEAEKCSPAQKTFTAGEIADLI